MARKSAARAGAAPAKPENPEKPCPANLLALSQQGLRPVSCEIEEQQPYRLINLSLIPIRDLCAAIARLELRALVNRGPDIDAAWMAAMAQEIHVAPADTARRGEGKTIIMPVYIPQAA